ncbi:hypothetical protein BCR32DRAFT_274303 [Anaeromyces robustus]|uniref:Uncharacterized protein n=1 Tax=Anaeromyces robustus TaxID=1754192 RepID=A0A1Y1XPN2_9FUNG|nr:hypothetical protein BCR32DRAFT_274303 [Anaeromyces robustus]|eukprot:ORX87692.1 hypothetical protein BCR32DRAFT_274303 [Anaeromyces robustus]
MVVSKSDKTQRIVESLINNQQLTNKNVKLEKNKNKGGKKNKKEKTKKEVVNNDLYVEIQNNEVEQQQQQQYQQQEQEQEQEQQQQLYDEFITATPDYLSYQNNQQLQLQQQQQFQNQFYNDGISNNSSPIQTDYYSIYNQLATNTLLSNVLGYNGYSQPMSSYYSPSPVYSTYSDVERSAIPMYSPNIYSYPLSAPINYNGYVIPYNLGMDMYDVSPTTKKSSNRRKKNKNTKKQALKDYLNHEQQVIAQFHKNIKENKFNKIAGKKKNNKDQKEIKKKRRLASKNLKINTKSQQKVIPIFDHNQIIKNRTRNKENYDGNNNNNQSIYNTGDAFPKYTKPVKKSSSNYNKKEPELQQQIQPSMSRNAPSGYSFDALPKRNTNIEFLLNNELILSFLNNVYNGFNWTSKLTNSKTNKNIGFLTKDNKSNEVISWKNSQTPGDKYSVASLLSMANSPVESGSIAKERRINRKELYEYWSNMARKSSITANNTTTTTNTNDNNKLDTMFLRMVQNKTISKSNDKLKQLNKKLLNKKSNSIIYEKEFITHELLPSSSSSNHPLNNLNYLITNINNNDTNNKNNHPIAAKFNEFYDHQQNMTIEKNNHGKITMGKKTVNDNDNNNISTTKNQAEELLNSNKDPNELFDYLLNLNMESSKKTTSTTKNFASADMLKPTQQSNENHYENIPTFTSPTLYSIPATVPNEVNPQYTFNSNKLPMYIPQNLNYYNASPYTVTNNNDNEEEISSGKNGKKGNKKNNNTKTLLTVLPQSLSNNSLLSVTSASSASSSIPEMDFSNVRQHYDFIIPKALPKKSKKSKDKKTKENNPTNSNNKKSALSQVQVLSDNDNNNDDTVSPDYSLINLMFNSDEKINQTTQNNNEKLSDKKLESVDKKDKDKSSNTSLVGYMFNSESNIRKEELSNTSLVGYMFQQ